MVLLTWYRVSPLGLAIGKYSLKKRLILDLSCDPLHISVNDLIGKESCSLACVKIELLV